MALSLPNREECEAWDPADLANFLSQSGMRECASTANRMNMDGRSFLNLTEGDLRRFSPVHRPQIQKMVQDIKKNDDSILNRLKRFQNEQAAFIRRTGRSTLDRIKNKAPPQLPDRDYREDNGDDNDCSSDFDSDTYEDPQAENDDSYEPPPCERVFNPTLSMSTHREEYADRCPRRPSPNPRIAQRPQRPGVPIPPSRVQTEEDDEDYVKPEADDDYIEPSENTVCPPVSRVRKPMKPHRGAAPAAAAAGTFADVYEVPDTEDEVPSQRPSSQLQLPPQRIPPRPSPRLRRTPVLPPKPEPADGDGDRDEDYEVCDAVENVSVKSVGKLAPTRPIPQPRDIGRNLPQKPVPKPPIIPPREQEAPLLGRPSPPEPRALSPRRGFHRARFSVSPGPTPNENRESEEKAGVLRRSWYASTCDRKMAEKALLGSNRDGAYMVRKSSGHDTLQPFTLVVLYHGRVYNIPIRFLPSSQQYALGREKMGEEHFSTVAHIIENHQRNPLVLIDSQSNSKDSTKLLHPIQV